MFGAYVKENRKLVVALTVYTAVFALVFWLYRLPLGAALVCLFLLLVWFAVDYRRFAARLRLLRRLEQEITLSTEQLPEPDGALEAQYQALVRALDADRRAQMTRSQRSYQDLVEYYTVWAHQIKTPIAAMRLLLQDADTDEQRALLEQLQSVEQYVEMVLGYLRLEPVVGLCHPQLRARRYRPAGGAQVCLPVHPAQAASGVYAAECQRHHG